MKGTQLAQLSDEYDLVKTNIDVIKNALVQKEAVLPEMKDVVRRAKEKVDKVELAGKLQDKMDLLEKQLAWALVAQQEGVSSPPFFFSNLAINRMDGLSAFCQSFRKSARLNTVIKKLPVCWRKLRRRSRTLKFVFGSTRSSHHVSNPLCFGR